MAQAYFLAMTIGLPLTLVALAMLAGRLHGDGYEELLDWKPTRSPEREAELEVADIDQMLAAQNRYRRMRGAPERTLEEVTEHAWARLEAEDLPPSGADAQPHRCSCAPPPCRRGGRCARSHTRACPHGG